MRKRILSALSACLFAIVLCTGTQAQTAGSSPAADTFPLAAKPALASELNGVFYVDGFPSGGCTVDAAVYTTQLDCAVASIAKWMVTANSPAVLMLGQRSSGTTYDTCTGITIPQQVNRSMSLIGEGSGGINQATAIRQVCPIKRSMLYKAAAPGNNLNQSIRISGIKLIGSGNASSCMDINGLQGSILENIYCSGAFTGTGGEDALVTFGNEPGGTGWIYETTFRNITVSGLKIEGPAKPAIVGVNVAGGTIANDGYRITNPGAGYGGDNPPIVYLWGFGAGGAPCKKMPQGLKATVVNGGISSIISSTPGEGCSGKIDVVVMNDSDFTYGMRFRNVTDSETENLVVRGSYKGASLYEQESPINNLHAHVYRGQYISFEDNGGVVWDAPQIDTPGHIGFLLNGPGTTIRSPLISANGSYPDGIGVLLGPKATETNLSGSVFCYPVDKASNWTRIATVQNGPIENGLPAGIKLHSSFTGTCDSADSPAAAEYDSGTPETGNSAVPYLSYDADGTTQPRNWSAAGTYFGINANGSFTGNFLDFRRNGAERFSVGSDGLLRSLGLLSSHPQASASTGMLTLGTPATPTAVTRNSADAQPALMVGNLNPNSKGDILDLDNPGGQVLSVTNAGNLKLAQPPGLPSTYTVDGKTITQPASAGTLALTSQLALAATTGGWNNQGHAIAAQSCVNGPAVNIAGAASHMVLAVTPVSNPGLGLVWSSAYLASGTTVQLVVCNVTTAPIVPVWTDYNVRAIP